MLISNKTIKSLAIKTLLTATTMLLSSQAMAGVSIKHILSQYYPINNQQLGCQGVMYETDGYCITSSKAEVGSTQSGEKLYILITGDLSFDTSGSETNGGHVSTGLVGMFVLSPSDDGGYNVEAANPTIPIGSWGKAPDEWTFHKFSPENWGFLTTTGYGMGGTMDYGFETLTPNGNGIKNSMIPSGNDNSGACGENGMPKCENLEAIIKINRNKIIDGFYPLNLTFNGTYDGKKYQNRKYQVPYNYDKGYKTPKNYPLNWD